MSKKILLTALFLTLLLAPNLALADGMIIPPPAHYMYETDQKGVIFFEEGIEILILSTSFKGDADNFAWVIPTPARPEVAKASSEIFTALQELTEVTEDQKIRPMIGLEYGMKDATQSVHVLEEKTIEYYDIAVLAADDKDALANWLNENGYYFPKPYAYVLDSYIKNRWFFTAVKITKDVDAAVLKQNMWSGSLIPLQLKFSTNKPVYPLKISSVINEPKVAPDQLPRKNYYKPARVGIELYIFTADKEQALPGLTARYAAWTDKETIENLAYNDNGEPWLEAGEDKYYLTKLTRYMKYSEMSNDLFFRDAEANSDSAETEERSRAAFYIIISIAIFITLGTAIFIIHQFNHN